MHSSCREAKEDDELVSVIDVLNNEQEADNFNSGRKGLAPGRHGLEMYRVQLTPF